VHGHVPDLPAPPATASEDRTVERDARADADLAGDVQEGRAVFPGGQLGHRRQVRLVVEVDRQAGECLVTAQQRDDVDVAPTEVGREPQPPGGHVDQSRQRHGGGHHAKPLGGGRRESSRRECGERGHDLLR
jgi:hypothetical protein